jgi:hypothetical protein
LYLARYFEGSLGRSFAGVFLGEAKLFGVLVGLTWRSVFVF